MPGWLGGETPEDTYNHVVGEGEFACHMTRHLPDEDMSRCRGSILFLKKMCKIPKYNIDLQRAVNAIDYKEAASDKNILLRHEFLNHHNQQKD
ncbi:MAG: hypothetical protein HC836_39305 [Richelia sp. RM2_1_2]|nr:hypothetical protein [Richelia sp. RM2_1_2]